jgi:oxygen-dependent protoporphyrinogen oxidase
MAPQRIWPFVTTPVLSWRAKCRLALEPFLPRRKSTEEETLASFSRRRLGREFYDRLVQPLAGGIYMGDPEQLSVQATFPQFAQMEQQHGSLARAARADLKRAAQTPVKDSGGPAYSMFVAPRLGMRQLVDAITQQLITRHAQLLPNHRVTSLCMTDSGQWSIEMANTSTEVVQPAEFDGVIVALTARQAAGLVGSSSAPLSQQLRAMPYEGCVVINLGYDRSAIPHPLDSFGFVTPYVEHLNILACTFTSVKYDKRAPVDKTLLRLYLGGARKADALEWSDARVLQTVQKELQQLLGISAPPELVRIHRWRDSMPQYHVGHEARVAEIETEVGKLPGLELTGNAYHGVGIPHCVRGGEQAADRLMSHINQSVSGTQNEVNRATSR